MRRGGEGGERVACNPKVEDKEKSDNDIVNVDDYCPEKFDKKGVFIRQRAKPNSVAVVTRERGITLF